MTAEIGRVVAAFCGGWSRRDAKALLDLWDIADPHATYLAAENVESLIGEVSIRAYIEGGCRNLQRIALRPGAIHARALGDALGLAFFPLSWSVQAGDRAPFGGDLRATMVMRKVGAAWRIFHYAEAPLAPLITLQRFYESIAAEGFPS